MKHPLYLIYGVLLLGLLGVAEYSGSPLFATNPNEVKNVPKSVRDNPGFTVLATLDEASYPNKRMKILWMKTELAMGKDHPIAWSHCVGKGRAFYAAPGHLPAVYAVPEYRTMLGGAIRWALKLEGKGCEG